MIANGLLGSWSALLLVAITTVGIYLGLILFSRIAGLRSFAEMTNFDLAATVAFGSIVATTAASTSTSLVQGLTALAVLFVVQAVVASLRRFHVIESSVDNDPRLLMLGGNVLVENLRKAQMTRNDLRAKLRLAGVTRLDRVRAVVLESSGEISVLADDPDGPGLDPELLSSVTGDASSWKLERL